MNGPLVTTIIPVFNRPAMLREAVASVLAQTHGAIEVVIVDDGSTDDTGSVADVLAREHPSVIRVVHIPNGGPGVAREAGRQLARGELIQHLDSDDVLLPRKFELQLAALRDAPECGAAYGWTRYRHEDGRVEPGPWKRSGEKIDTLFPAMLRSRWWDTPTPLYRRAVIDRAGAWTTLRIEEDWEYDCRIASSGVRLAYCPEWVAEVRAHASTRATGRLDVPSLRDRARAHELILRHGQRANAIGTPEGAHFARELFLLARQCGAAALPRESRRLFELAREASGDRRNGIDFHAYALLAGAIGWSGAGRLTCLADRLRRRRRSADKLRHE